MRAHNFALGRCRIAIRLHQPFLVLDRPHRRAHLQRPVERRLVPPRQVGQKPRRPRPAIAVIFRQIGIHRERVRCRQRNQQLVGDARRQVVFVLDPFQPLRIQARVLPLQRRERSLAAAPASRPAERAAKLLQSLSSASRAAQVAVPRVDSRRSLTAACSLRFLDRRASLNRVPPPSAAPANPGRTAFAATSSDPSSLSRSCGSAGIDLRIESSVGSVPAGSRGHCAACVLTVSVSSVSGVRALTAEEVGLVSIVHAAGKSQAEPERTDPSERARSTGRSPRVTTRDRDARVLPAALTTLTRSTRGAAPRRAICLCASCRRIASPVVRPTSSGVRLRAALTFDRAPICGFARAAFTFARLLEWVFAWVGVA